MKNIDSNTHLRGESIYLDDIPVLSGTLYAAVFDSPIAHGKIKSLELADALIEKFNKPFFIHEHKIDMTASIGICFYPESGEDMRTLLRNADAAMYEAKKKGKNIYKIFKSCQN